MAMTLDVTLALQLVLLHLHRKKDPCGKLRSLASQVSPDIDTSNISFFVIFNIAVNCLQCNISPSFGSKAKTILRHLKKRNVMNGHSDEWMLSKPSGEKKYEL